MGILKTLGITIFIIAAIFVGIYLFYNNQHIATVGFVTSPISTQLNQMNTALLPLRENISKATGIPVSNVITITPVSAYDSNTSIIMIDDVAIRTQEPLVFLKYPYNNTFLYINNFTLIFPPGSKILNIPKNTIVPVEFYVETQSQLFKYGWANASVLDALPKVTINYEVNENGLKYTFNFINPNKNNNVSNITYTVPINALSIGTIGMVYNNSFYMFLYK